MNIEGEYGNGNFNFPPNCKDLKLLLENHNNVTRLRVQREFYLVDQDKIVEHFGDSTSPSELQKLKNCVSEINNQRKLFDMTSFPFVSTLKSLSILGFDNLETIQDRDEHNTSILEKLFIHFCKKFSFTGLNFEKLEFLKIDDCDNVTFLPSLKSLKTLEINNSKITDLSTFLCENLESIEIKFCDHLSRCDFSGLTKLKTIRVQFCNTIENLKIENCPNLESLTISHCDTLETLDLSSQEPIPKNLLVSSCHRFPKTIYPQNWNCIQFCEPESK
jgi:Leucine-rich repeat (LRR) protein